MQCYYCGCQLTRTVRVRVPYQHGFFAGHSMQNSCWYCFITNSLTAAAAWALMLWLAWMYISNYQHAFTRAELDNRIELHGK